MQQNWFTTALIAVLAGALGAVGFGVAGAQSDDGAPSEPVTINLDQPVAGADGSADSVSLVCPDGSGGTGQGGGGGTPSNTNTLVNGVEIQNENQQDQDQDQQQAEITVPDIDGVPADAAPADAATPAPPASTETPEVPDTTGTESTPDAESGNK